MAAGDRWIIDGNYSSSLDVDVDSPVMNKVTRVLFALLLGFAVSTTSVSCVPPYCPLTGGPAVIC